MFTAHWISLRTGLVGGCYLNLSQVDHKYSDFNRSIAATGINRAGNGFPNISFILEIIVASLFIIAIKNFIVFIVLYCAQLFSSTVQQDFSLSNASIWSFFRKKKWNLTSLHYKALKDAQKHSHISKECQFISTHCQFFSEYQYHRQSGRKEKRSIGTGFKKL